jgi:hypothetical protein
MKDKLLSQLIEIQCSRRTFLKYTGATAGLLLSKLGEGKEVFAHGTSGNRVVAVKDRNLTTWNGSDYWYGSDSFVSQTRLDDILIEGVKSLTGQSTELAAWNQIIPNYSNGNKIAIKMNENNGGIGGNVIDPLPQLLKALIRGLKARGIAESDIWFIEPSIRVDDRLAQPVKSAYPGVTFYGAYATAYSAACTYTSSDPSLTISHGNPNIPNSKLPDQLASSTYLIHMPITKAHGLAGVTLTYKNLIGLFQRSTIQKFHNYFFNTTNNPLVEIYANSNVGGKTVLIIGDCVYGNWVDNYTAPSRWSTFGNDWPKMVLFATDPAAIDCVMYDFLNWQNPRTAQHETYLVQAAIANQGTRDHWNNPTDKTYSVIDFVQRDMANVNSPKPSPPANLRFL